MDKYTLADRLRMLISRRLRAWGIQQGQVQAEGFHEWPLIEEGKTEQAKEMEFLVLALSEVQMQYAEVIYLHYVSELKMSDKLACAELSKNQYQYILKQAELWLAKRLFQSLAAVWQ